MIGSAETVPSAALAALVAEQVTGASPIAVTRFTTGAQHYVYEAQFAQSAPVVVRIGSQSAHAEMAGAVHLSALLRPRGVPLPALLAQDIEANLPWIVLERLAGGDLGGVIGSLSENQLDGIAAGVAAAQAAAGQTGSAGRYGYAIRPEDAPFGRWEDVLAANLNRSRQRMTAHGLFDTSPIDVVETILATQRERLADIAATPFLHDTTTKNVIIDPTGTLSGIVDVDDLCFGDPRYPAALTLAALLAYGGPPSYVTAWLRHAGQLDDAVFRLYVALFLRDLMAEHGGVFNGNEQKSKPEDRSRMLAAFTSIVAMARE
ncbi:aminoglycoside phosphotransferase (APT) family kinase protein [Devosia sp. UYZn731]|uniref:phosphotransferase family protein n=1 Tax=Devosia sp. UYZn731 TaxID=3156345 RepID=UPI003393FAEF